jgi:C1A family cysteine protease
MTDDN